MAVTVNIDLPGFDPVQVPSSASGTVTLVVATDGSIEAMWYQIDGGDAIDMGDPSDPTGTGTPLNWVIALASLADGEHVLSVYARSAGAGGTPPAIAFADKVFTVTIFSDIGQGPLEGLGG